LQAAQRFDETRGFKFISYAVWWIRQAILQAIAEKTRTIRLPLNRIGTLTKISKVYSKLEQELERAPTTDEVSNMLDIDSDNISYTINKASRVVSLDSPLSSNTNNRLVDVVIDDQPGPDSDLMHNSLKDDIKYMLKDLPYREAKILKLYFGLDGEKPHTLEDVGRKFKLTRERIRQIKEKALKRLLNSPRSKLLQQYL
jgi:RNA polymerase primary sigma factor